MAYNDVKLKTSIDQVTKSLQEVADQAVKSGRIEQAQEKDTIDIMLKHVTTLAELVQLRKKYNKALRDAEKEMGVREETKKALPQARKELRNLQAQGAPAANIQSLQQQIAAGEKYLRQTQQIPKYVEAHSKAVEALSHRITDQKNTLKDATKAQVDNSKSLMEWSKRLSIATQKIITYRIAYGAYRLIVDTMKEAKDAAIEFENTMQDLRKVMDGSESDFTRLADQAYRLGIKYGKSANEIASTFSIFAQQGLNVNEVLDRTNAVLLLSATSAISAAESVEALTAVVEAYPEYVNNVTAAVDKWASVQAKAPLTTQDLANSVKQIGSTAKEVGVDLDDLNGIVAAINKTTRKSGKEIGNSLKTIFAYVPRKETMEAFKSLGIAVMKSQDELRDFPVILADLSEKWGTLKEKEKLGLAMTMGGVRRFNDFIALMNNYGDSVKYAADSFLAQGEAQKMLNPELDKTSRKLESMKTAMSETSMKIAKSVFLPLLTDLTYRLAKFINVVGAASKGIGTFGRYFVPVSAGLGGITVALFLLNKLLAYSSGNLIIFIKQLLFLEAATNRAGVALTGFARIVGFVGRAFLLINIIGAIAIIFQLIASIGKAKKANQELKNSIIDYEKEAKKAADAEEARRRALLDTDTYKQVKLLRQQIELLDAEIQLYDKTPDRLKEIEDRFAAIAEERKKLQTTRNENAPSSMGFADDQAPAGMSKDYVEAGYRLLNLYVEEQKLLTERNKLNSQDLKADADREQKRKDLVALSKKLSDILNGTQDKFLPITLTKYLESMHDINAQLKTMKTYLIISEDLAKRYGEAFNPTKAKLDEIRKAEEGLIDINRQIAEEQIRYNEMASIRAMLYGDEAKEMAAQMKNVQDNLKYLEEQRDITKQRTRDQPILTAELQRQKKEQIDITEMARQQVAALDMQIRIHQIAGKGIQKMSSMRAIDATILSTILQEEYKILELEKQKEQKQLNAEYRSENIGNSQEDINKKLEYEGKLREINNRYAEKQVEIQLQLLEQASKSVKNIQAEIANAFASSFAEIPDKIQENAKKRKEIAKERKETERELAIAQAKNDQEGINSAKKKLNDLKNELRTMPNIFADMLNKVGDVGIKRWGENFANAILTDKAAEFLASGIVPASYKGAMMFYNAITSAMEKGAKGETEENVPDLLAGAEKADKYAAAMAKAPKTSGEGFNLSGFDYDKQEQKMYAVYQDAGGKQKEMLLEAGNVNANKWRTAIQQGGNLAAVALIRGMGLATGEMSNAMSNIGSMFGSAAGTELIGGMFGGPIGTLIGGLLGAGIGSLFDKEPKAYNALNANTLATQANTTAVNNNNELLSLQREFINAPTNYIPPPAYGHMGYGNMTVNISVNGSGSPSATAEAVAAAFDRATADSFKNSGNNFKRFGR